MSGEGLALSGANTLIVPVALESLGEVAARPAVSLGGLTLVRKKEHHVTVFGFPIGKVLKKAFAAEPSLRAAIDGAIASFDWTIRVGTDLFHLERANDKGVLHTVIVSVEADLAGVFASVRGIVAEHAPGQAELLALLEASPPPHVTLYTSDPGGGAGIGLVSEAELAAALARSASGEEGLRAYRITEAELSAG